MPPKGKALAMADTNAAPAKKLSKGKTATEKTAPTPGDEVFKYSDPNTVINQEPVDITFLMWPENKGDEESEDDEDDIKEYDDPRPEPGSLQDILDKIETEKSEAYTIAFDAYMKLHTFICQKDTVLIKEEVFPPFNKRVEKAREEAVNAGLMTASEANAIKGVSEKDRKRKRRYKKGLQESLNYLQRQRNAAVHDALDKDSSRNLTVEEKRARIAEAEKPFLKKMDKSREYLSMPPWLTEEEAKTMMPNIVLDDDGKEIPKPKSAAQLRKEAEEKAFVAPRVVTDKGLPITQAGMKKMAEICEEVDNRNPDMHAMYIYNDFAGYGVNEVMENLMSEFNKVIFKKDISPIEKWTIVEGLTTYLHLENSMLWMMVDDSNTVEEVLNIFGVMFVTGLEMLHESNLIKGPSPLPENIGIMTLLFLGFMADTCQDFKLTWLHEIVRAADQYGVVLTIPEGKRIPVSQTQLDKWRKQYNRRAPLKGFVWKTKYATFRRKHAGGIEFDITKMSKAEKARYKFSNKRNSGSDGSEEEQDDDDDDGWHTSGSEVFENL